MKILLAERPHARILSIKTDRAEASRGVVAVYTSKDVAFNANGLQIPDQPVLCGPLAGTPIPHDMVSPDLVRFVGDQVAVVVAESEAQASAALKLIEVEYADLPALVDPLLALKTDAPLLHPERGSDNICVHYRIRKGDIDQGFDRADVIVTAEYHTPPQEHAYLQPEAGLAYMDEEDRITVVVAGQWTHEDLWSISHALDLEDDRIRLVYPAIGGAFGGREDMSAHREFLQDCPVEWQPGDNL